ncbi:hypothetical protein [Pedobacter nyackensis]|uniref:Uncharacterized protein n=1 Tax=Pedobacter nyackensis TaxID=475255 RepID=A0A1W1ZXL9_9SPHI|nr:hypothetical protein [Pedobacter nyackensis]SMC53154.1 hypothetical protein SAMN04488101_101133 [Pedobacter nyackensis]
METPLWMQVRESPGAAAKKAIYQEAIISGCWIFSTVSKKWYTPDEFMASTETVHMHRDKDDGRKFVVKHPLVGLQERIDLLHRTAKEIDEFNKRLHNYYELRRKQTKQPHQR